jgi:hypothetical protein
MKTCTRCLTAKPARTDYFRRESRTVIGRTRVIKGKAKCCTQCHEKKPLKDFYRAKFGKHGRKSKCKGCTDHQTVAWRRIARRRARTVGVINRFLMGA